MELIPIIKLALVVFAGFVGLSMIISYFLYKIKNAKMPKRSDVQATPVKQFVTTSHKVKVSGVHTKDAAQNDQAYYVPQRKVHQQVVKQQPAIAPRERFQVLNHQIVEERPAVLNLEQKKAFYQPRTNYNVFTPSQTAKSLFDRYSSGNERLHKLNFNGNI